MGAAALPIIAGVGTLGGLLQGNQANRNARSALNAQQQQAQAQQGLFNETSPIYGQLLHALGGYAGLNNPTPSQPGLTPGAGMPGGSFTGAVQLPYTNITPGQLGPYGNPADALRLRAAEDAARVQTNNALNQYSFGTGQRGLYGSSIDAAGRSAIISDALRGQSDFGRQLAINAPQEYAARLGLVGNALNPGLAAGPVAAGIYGQGAATNFGQGQYQAGMLSNALNSYQQYKALQGIGNQYAPTGLAQLQKNPGSNPGLAADLTTYGQGVTLP
jgi:hypothetical protein